MKANSGRDEGTQSPDAAIYQTSHEASLNKKDESVLLVEAAVPEQTAGRLCGAAGGGHAGGTEPVPLRRWG